MDITDLEALLLAHDHCELCGAVVFPWDRDHAGCLAEDVAHGPEDDATCGA